MPLLPCHAGKDGERWGGGGGRSRRGSWASETFLLWAYTCTVPMWDCPGTTGCTIVTGKCKPVFCVLAFANRLGFKILKFCFDFKLPAWFWKVAQTDHFPPWTSQTCGCPCPPGSREELEAGGVLGVGRKEMIVQQGLSQALLARLQRGGEVMWEVRKGCSAFCFMCMKREEQNYVFGPREPVPVWIKICLSCLLIGNAVHPNSASMLSLSLWKVITKVSALLQNLHFEYSVTVLNSEVCYFILFVKILFKCVLFKDRAFLRAAIFW